jgi:putative ABC transport system permease protein
MMLRELWAKLTRSVRGRRDLEDLQDELNTHLEMELEAAEATGADPTVVRKRFGNRTAIAESAYDQWTLVGLESILMDIRRALRDMVRNPLPTGIAFLSIALSVGAAAVVFTAIKAVLIDPLPYSRPEELVQLRTEYPRFPKQPRGDWLSWEDGQEIIRRTHTLEAIGLYRNAFLDLAGNWSEPPEALCGTRITANLFPMLGVSPMLGRNILPEEDQAGHPDVMILSHGLWVRMFNSDRGVVGRTVKVNGRTSRVIGVMPPGFDFPMRRVSAVRTPSPYSEFWAPLAVAREGGHSAVARLKPGVSLNQARHDLASTSDALAKEFPATNRDRVLRLNFVRDRTAGNAKSGLMMLLASAILFMLIGCSNVANLLLARGQARQREISIRLAIGAGAGRIVRQLLTESCVLAILGGFGGYLLTVAAWRILPALAPVSIPRLAAASADSTILSFALVVGVVNGILFGMMPALRAVRNQGVILNAFGSRGAVSGARDRMSSVLVVAEVALSALLVVLGGEFLGGFSKLRSTDPGLDVDRVVASIILPAPERYGDPEKQERFYGDVLNFVQSIPGVDSAGTVDALPFSGENNGALVSGSGSASGKEVTAEVDVTGGEYLQTIGLHLTEGRWFRTEEMDASNDAAIVNNFLARKLWPGASALGQPICIHCTPGNPPAWKHVVGVVSDSKHAALNEPDEGFVYLAAGALRTSAFLVVRTERPAEEIEKSIRRVIAKIDPHQAVFLVAPLKNLIADSVADQRFVMILLVINGCLGLFMSAAGVYGVISYVTSRRTAEIGIRMVVGATPRSILFLIFQHSFLQVAIGLVIGLACALASLPFLRSLLTSFEPGNPAYVWIAAGLVAIAAAIACWVPARRATAIEPLTALQRE